MIPWIARRPRGFTLIELLIVITIISILIVILVVVARPPTDKVKWDKVRESLDQALRSYEQTFDGMFPPSNNSSVGSGAECLYYYLMGPGGKGWSPSNGNVAANYTWGPAKELAQDWMIGQSGSRKYFIDGNAADPMPVLYYRANRVPNATTLIEPIAFDEVYRVADNAAYFSPTTGSNGEWKKLIANPASSKNAPFNPTSYILWSAGVDRKFGYVEGKCDDFTNFKRPN